MATLPTLRKDLYSTCMEALDDIGWGYGFSFSAYGVELGLRVTDYDLLDNLRNHLPFKSISTNATIVDCLFSVVAKGDIRSKSTRYNFYWNQMLFAKDILLKELQEKFKAMGSVAVADLSNEKLFIHCGVVGWKGKAILVPGRTHTGKSSLIKEMVKSGAIYYSDEFAVIDDEGYIHPYTRPISIRHPLTHKQQDVFIEDIGGRIGVKRLPVGLVILTEYKKYARWNPMNISAGNGLLAMLDNTHSAQRSPERAMRILKQAIYDAAIISSPRGSAKLTAERILADFN